MTNPATGTNSQQMLHTQKQSLDRDQSWHTYFLFLPRKTDLLPKTVPVLGKLESNILPLKWCLEFTVATCEFKYLELSIKVYLSRKKFPLPLLDSIKFYLFTNTSLWPLQL